MALYECTIKYDFFGNEVDCIMYSEGPLELSPKEQGISSAFVKMFHYKVESPTPPSLFQTLGKKYIVPGWQPVHPNTELSDIIWVKPKTETETVVIEKEKWEFIGSDGVTKYFVRKTGNLFRCTCPGYYRSHSRECKHIKECKSK